MRKWRDGVKNMLKNRGKTAEMPFFGFDEFCRKRYNESGFPCEKDEYGGQEVCIYCIFYYG